jgi:hypothetical protein
MIVKFKSIVYANIWECHNSAMSTRELIEKELAALPKPLQQEVYDFAVRLRKIAGEDSFNGAGLSESVLARDWNSPDEDAAWANL